MSNERRRAIAKGEAFIERFLADPEKYFRRWDAEARKENPRMTEEQRRAAWEQVRHQFGF